MCSVNAACFMQCSISTIIPPICLQEWERGYTLYKAQTLMDVGQTVSAVMNLKNNHHEDNASTMSNSMLSAASSCSLVSKSHFLKHVPTAIHARLEGAARGVTSLPSLVMSKDHVADAGAEEAVVAHQVICEMNDDTFSALMDLMGLTTCVRVNSDRGEAMVLMEEEDENGVMEMEEEDW